MTTPCLYHPLICGEHLKFNVFLRKMAEFLWLQLGFLPSTQPAPGMIKSKGLHLDGFHTVNKSIDRNLNIASVEPFHKYSLDLSVLLVLLLSKVCNLYQSKTLNICPRRVPHKAAFDPLCTSAYLTPPISATVTGWHPPRAMKEGLNTQILWHMQYIKKARKIM